MAPFDVSLLLAAFLCSLVAGLLLAFAIVVMPGIRSLSDKDFIRTFQVIDRVIQKNQPIFMLLWVGSVVAVAVTAVLGAWQWAGVQWWLMIVAAGIYFLGVQLPTGAVNIPLNNELHAIDVVATPEPTLRRARDRFEHRWNRWNVMRTVCASVTSLLLLILLFMTR